MSHPSVAALLAFLVLAIASIVAPPGAADDERPPAPAPGAPPAGPSTGGGTTNRGEALPGGAPELANYKDKIVFIVDRSGSMAIADRFAKALDIVEQLLLEMPKDTKFDIYLATETSHSLFEGEWLRPAAEVRKSLRSRIAAVGGLDYGGFTDLITPIKTAAERRRPDAVYLLSDGVATINELETEKIVGAVVKVALQAKVPVHTIAVGVGQDVAEDAEQAIAVLKGIAEQTGGIFREVKSETRSRGRAFLLPPPWLPPPAEDLARIHLKTAQGKEIRGRFLSYSGRTAGDDVVVEIEDPALKAGPIALEYAEPKLVVRTFLANAKLFLETRPIGLKRAGDRLVSTLAVRFVGPQDDSPPDEANTGGSLPVKCPSGGSVEFVYKRGSREFREAALISTKPPNEK